MDPDDFWALAGEHCTERELEALRLRAKGASYREGAALLGITKQAYCRRLRRSRDRLRARKYPRSGSQTR